MTYTHPMFESEPAIWMYSLRRIHWPPASLPINNEDESMMVYHIPSPQWYYCGLSVFGCNVGERDREFHRNRRKCLCPANSRPLRPPAPADVIDLLQYEEVRDNFLLMQRFFPNGKPWEHMYAIVTAYIDNGCLFHALAVTREYPLAIIKEWPAVHEIRRTQYSLTHADLESAVPQSTLILLNRIDAIWATIARRGRPWITRLFGIGQAIGESVIGLQKPLLDGFNGSFWRVHSHRVDRAARTGALLRWTIERLRR